MENAFAADIITRIGKGGQPLHPSQKENVSKIISISKEFSDAAHLPFRQSFFSSEPDVVIESGHQPNFLPYTGVIKKVFLLHWIARHLARQDHHPVAFFGFADQNLSTASYLYENILPSVNKSGYEKIGFRIREKDRWKCFNTIEKPPREIWQEEIEKIRMIYQKQRKYEGPDTSEIRNRSEQIIGILEKSYELANNFADVNAYFFSKLCVEVFGLDVFFFRYSDIQKKAIFAQEWKELISDNDKYVRFYNTAITNNSSSLHPLAKDHVPFWYHCGCGGNVPLVHADAVVKGTCPSCGKEHVLTFGDDYLQLESHLPGMSLTAVARNLVFAKGLGTRIFISGAGGGLEYGRISDDVAGSLNFPLPVTLAWASRDFYLGQTHRTAIINFQKLFKISGQDLIQSSAVEKIHHYRNELWENIRRYSSNPADKKLLQKYQGQFNNSTIQLEIIKKIFSVTPSMLDVVINISSKTLLDTWNKSVEHASFNRENTTWKMQKDTTYNMPGLLNIRENEISLIYQNIHAIEMNQP